MQNSWIKSKLMMMMHAATYVYSLYISSSYTYQIKTPGNAARVYSYKIYNSVILKSMQIKNKYIDKN